MMMMIDNNNWWHYVNRNEQEEVNFYSKHSVLNVHIVGRIKANSLFYSITYCPVLFPSHSFPGEYFITSFIYPLREIVM